MIEYAPKSWGGTRYGHVQQALELMNIKLKNVISQIHGYSGLQIIRAILDGERNEEKLLSLCHVRIRGEKAEEVKNGTP